jgi:hypothetical protein
MSHSPIQQSISAAYGPQPYGAVTISYNLASHAIDKHLDQAVEAYAQWKKVQEGDVVRNLQALHQQLLDTEAA